METVIGWVPALAGWFAGLFTQMEWRTFWFLAAAVIGLTQTVKFIWRLSPIPGGGSARWLNAIAIVASIILSLLFWQGDWLLRLVMSFIIGPFSILLFKLGFAGLKVWLPDVARIINADRRKDSQPVKKSQERRNQ